MLRRASVVFLGAAWICYVVSFFLPVTRGMFAINGFGAAAMCAQMLIEPRTDASFIGQLYYGLFTVANLLMLLSPGLWIMSWRKQNALGWFRVTTILLVLYVGSLDVLCHDDGGLESGYFLWTISFMLLAGATELNGKEIRSRFSGLPTTYSSPSTTGGYAISG